MPPNFVLSTSVSRSDYGQWTAFLALLVRLFFFIPGRVTNTTHKTFMVNFFLVMLIDKFEVM